MAATLRHEELLLKHGQFRVLCVVVPGVSKCAVVP